MVVDVLLMVCDKINDITIIKMGTNKSLVHLVKCLEG